MAYTKQDIINYAFEEIGLAGYVFDLQPQQQQSALNRLDSLMATWNGKGLRLGYNMPSSNATSSLSDDAGISDMAFEAAALNLAIRIAPGYGKTPSPDTKIAARIAYNQLAAQAAKPIEMQIDNRAIPAGAGHRLFYRDPFLNDPRPFIDAGPDSILDLGADYDHD
jgi:hypothetical protein